MGRALIINVLEFSIEGIFTHIVVFLLRGVRTNKADVIKCCPDADFGYFFVHRCEPRDKVAKTLTNHKSFAAGRNPLIGSMK